MSEKTRYFATLDNTTRRLIFEAHRHTKFNREGSFELLRDAVAAFDAAHDKERAENLLRAIFPTQKRSAIARKAGIASGAARARKAKREKA